MLAEHKEEVKKIRMGNAGFWKWSTGILLVLLILSLYMSGFSFGGEKGKEDVADKTVAFVNENLLAGFGTAIFQSVTKENGFYKIEVNLVSTFSEATENATLYVSKDGDLLFPTAIDMSEFEYAQEETREEQSSETALEDPIIGNPEARLSIIEYSDFECPFCGEAYWTLKLVLEEYADNVNLVYKNFPLPSHENAQKAAEAAECAHTQGMFEAYHDIIFENQDALTVEDLKKYASDLGLDTTVFNECLDSGTMAAEVAADKEEGTKLGVTGTPTFFIGEQTMEGNQMFAEFKRVIDEELAKLPTEESPEEDKAESFPSENASTITGENISE